MLDELASNGETTIQEKSTVEALLEEAKALDQKKQMQEKTNEIDNSFYTSSLNFDRRDFEDLYEKEVKKSRTNLKIKLVAGVILGLISLTIIFIIYKFIG